MKRVKRLLSKRNNGGFTLVEVIISTALLGILVLGMTMFMSPLFGIMQDNTADVRANNLGTTLNYYLSRSVRNACFVAVFTNTKYEDFTSNDGSAHVNTLKEMIEYVNKNKNTHRMKCISIRRVQDYKGTNQKYMLFNEKVGADGLLVSSDNSTGNNSDRLVFEKCYYEGLFPTVEFSQPYLAKLKDGEDGKEEEDYEATTELAPTIQINVTIRDKDGTDANDVIFVGEGYSEIRNVKMSQKDTSLNLKYKIYDPVPKAVNSTADEPNTDTFIFYVERILQ